MSTSNSPCSPVKLTRGLVLTIAFFLAGVSTLSAQPRELFAPTPNNRATLDESRLIAHLRKQPTTKDLKLVRINIAALLDDQATMTYPGRKTLNFTRRSIEKKDETNFTWHGTMPEFPGTATLVVHDGNVTGTIQNGPELYHIEPIGRGVHAIVRIDPSKFPPEEPPSFQYKQKVKPLDLDRRTQKLGPSAQDVSAGPVNISVIVAYTQSAEDSVADIDATIRLAVAEANQAYANSGINIQLNLAGTFLFPYSEAGKTFGTIMADFVSNSAVNMQRTQAGANLAALIVNQPDYCGLADAIMANSRDAYAIVHYSCATGYYSFAHELGHLMGARHDEEHDPNTTPFAYGHGYENNSTTQPFRTVMAYRCETGNCEPRVQYFSNPNVNYAGVATGTAATNDNARVLNATAGTVAAFRSPLLTIISGNNQYQAVDSAGGLGESFAPLVVRVTDADGGVGVPVQFTCTAPQGVLCSLANGGPQTVTTDASGLATLSQSQGNVGIYSQGGTGTLTITASAPDGCTPATFTETVTPP